MLWQKRGTESTVQEVVNRNTNGKANEFLYPTFYYDIPNLSLFANWLGYYIQNSTPITIIGDFDCDGICATSELWLLLKSFGCYPRIRFPRRLSEGYGFSEDMVDEINEGVIITVDNGIKAFKAIEKAKAKGMVVMVMDHHQPDMRDGQPVLPCADLIVDPHVPEQFIRNPYDINTNNLPCYQYYCAAGLVYKLACFMTGDQNLLGQICVLASFATIADVVELTGDNRNIFTYGKYYISQGTMTLGTKELIESLNTNNYVDETSYGFRIAPMINAPGRLIDKGAEAVFTTLVTDKPDVAKAGVEFLRNVNQERKEIRNEACKRADEIITGEHMEDQNPIIILDEETPEGVVGLVAGYITETYDVTSIVFTKNQNGGYRGSARAHKDDSIIAALDQLNEIHPEYFYGYGGHPGAAGMTIKEECISDFKRELSNIMGERHERKEIMYYDLEVSVKDIPNAIKEVKKYAPYGNGNERIVFRVNDFKLSPRYNELYKLIGEDSIRFYGNNVTAIGFGLADKFQDSAPERIDMIGTLGENRYMNYVDNQIELVDFNEVSFPKNEIEESIQNALI